MQQKGCLTVSAIYAIGRHRPPVLTGLRCPWRWPRSPHALPLRLSSLRRVNRTMGPQAFLGWACRLTGEHCSRPGTVSCCMRVRMAPACCSRLHASGCVLTGRYCAACALLECTTSRINRAEPLDAGSLVRFVLRQLKRLKRTENFTCAAAEGRNVVTCKPPNTRCMHDGKLA